jgi:hypothetical protein
MYGDVRPGPGRVVHLVRLEQYLVEEVAAV